MIRRHVFLLFTPNNYIIYTSSVTEPCHFDKVLDPVHVPTSYFPSYGSGSGSLHTFKKMLKIKFILFIFLLKLDGNMLILTWNILL